MTMKPPPNNRKSGSDDEKPGTVECPCCGAKLFYDPVRRQLRSAAPGLVAGKDLSFEAAVAELRSEKDKVDEKFRAAFEKEGRRKESLEQKFEKARKDAGDSPEPPPRPFDFD